MPCFFPLIVEIIPLNMWYLFEFARIPMAYTSSLIVIYKIIRLQSYKTIQQL